MNFSLKAILPHIGAVAIFLLLSILYFLPQFQGKVIAGNDSTQFEWSVQETRDFRKRTGERTNWTNSMFAGMPNYQISAIGAGNKLYYAEKILTFNFKRPTGRFLLAMLAFYILMQLLGANYWVCIIGAFAFAFTTNNLVLYMTGHITKVRVISILPIATAGLLLVYKRKYIFGGLLFALGMGLAVYYNHPQMVYYFTLTLIGFAIAQFIHDIKNKNYKHFVKGSTALIIAGVMSLLSAAGNLWVTYDYSKDTIRGKAILTNTTTGNQAKDGGTGLDWDYAMAWSNNTMDCFASLIPGLVDGSSSELTWKDSETMTRLKKKGYRGKSEIGVPLYWGALPFTAGPIYFGITMCLLFFMGLVLVKGPVKWWLAFGVLLTFMLSMGKNLSFFNEFFFNHVPLYSKFRTPNSVLSVTAFLIPFLGILALDKIVKKEVSKEEVLKSLYIGVGITGGLAAFFAILGPSFFDFTALSDVKYKDQIDIGALIIDRKALMRGDSFRALILVLGCGGLIWAYIQGKIQQTILIAGIGILTFYDIWTIDKRYLSDANYKPASTQKSAFLPSAADTKILQDKSLDYRVLDMSENTYNSAKASYFHKSIGGYSAAKLRRYQDILERHLAPGNQKVFNMLNTKWYIRKGKDGKPQAQENTGALGNAWFVNKIIEVQTADDEIDALNDFTPRLEAIVHTAFMGYLNGLQPNGVGEISLEKYEPNHLVYKSNSNSEQLAVFSEVWYGPDKGWQAYIDGKEVAHIRSNYILRAMKVPAGQHTIEFKFQPKTYSIGLLVSQIASWTTILGIFAYLIFLAMKKMKAKEDTPNKL